MIREPKPRTGLKSLGFPEPRGMMLATTPGLRVMPGVARCGEGNRTLIQVVVLGRVVVIRGDE